MADSDILAHAAPFQRFGDWFAEAETTELNDPNAFALATADAQGRPSVRVVLLKGWDERGFVFFTNHQSRKGRELLANPFCHMDFHWKSLRRQVRVDGQATPITDAESDAYFATRPRDSQIGAWASEQSRPLPDRALFETRIAEFSARFGDGPVPRPPHWGGFRIVPARIEFWLDEPGRLHRRDIYDAVAGGWAFGHQFP